MTCGLGLGILVVFFVQAEHVCCFWTKSAQNIQKSNTHVGFPPSDGRLLKSSSYPQNQVRQGFVSPHSVQSSSFNTGPAVYSGSGPGLFSSSAQVVSQPAHSSVRLVQSSSVFKANRQKLFSPRANGPAVLKQSSGLSSAVAGGTSVSQHRENQKNPSDFSRRSWPVKQGLQRSSKYPSSSSRSPQALRESYSFRPVSPLSAAQEPSRAAGKAPYHSQVDSSAGLFGPVAPRQSGPSVQMQTHARGSAKRVFSNRKSEGPKPRRLSPVTKAWKPSVGQEGGSRPRSWLQSSRTSYNLAVPRSSTVGGSATVHEIPEHLGGFAIRRLKPADQNKVTVQKQQVQIPTTAPQWLVPYPRPETRWSRVKL